MGLVLFVGLWRQFRSEGGLAALSAEAGLAGAIILFAMVGVSGGGLQAEAFVTGRHGALGPGLAEALSTMFVSVFNLSVAATILLAVGFSVSLLCGRWPRPLVG